MLYNFKKTDNIAHYYKDKYYIYINEDSFGQVVRLGDLTMLAVLLYTIKKQLINMFDIYTWNNLFFMFRGYSKFRLTNIKQTLGYFKYIFAYNNDNTDNANFEKFKLNNIINCTNLWIYKEYLNIKNFKKDEDDPDLIILPNNNSSTKKDEIFILPILGKMYNVERNWSIDNINNVIRKFYDRKINIIHIDNYKFDSNKIKTFNNTVFLLTNVTWDDIIRQISQKCSTFITGDCGLGHFVSNMSDQDRPETIYHHYVTKDCKDENSVQNVNQICSDKFKLDSINFRPYSIYDKSNIKPIYI